MGRRVVSTDSTIGDRLRKRRAERGLTQEELATRAGVSVDLIKKLERGARQGARLTTLTALANALDVSIAELVDKRPRLDGAGGDRLVLSLRDALLTPHALPGIDPDDDGTPTPMADLQAALTRGWAAYWAGRFAELSRMLPGLLGEARITAAATGPAAAGCLAQAHQLAACLLVHLGREDLAALGAERGIVAARAGDDELLWAALCGTYSWALLAQARHAEAEDLAARIAQRIEPRFSVASPQHITVWGGLVLWAMAAAVEADRAEVASEFLSLARTGAARMEHERMDYQSNFGPTQVAMQTTYAHAVLGEPGKALEAARGVRREDLRTISYGRHLLDVAWAYADARRGDLAVQALYQAKSLAPVWFRHQPPARTLVADLAERQSRVSPALRDLVQSLDPH